MRRPTLLVPLALAALVSLAGPLRGQGVPIGFEEDFALASDRAAVLARLIPGTEEDFFYRCLLAQHEGRLDEVPDLLRQWIARHGRGVRVEQIENRQALLTYERDPQGTYEHLQRRLGLRFDHEQRVPGARPDLPTRLDQALISREALDRRALELHPGSLDGFADRALPALARRADLDADRLHELLQRLERPELPGLAELVVRDLGRRNSPGFGSLAIHRNLLLEQLAECARLRPALLEDGTFVEVWLERLRPGDDVDWRYDARERLAYLERLEAFTRRLAPVHDSLQAHVLYHRLAHDLQQGAPDKARLMAYLRLPRQVGYANPELVREASRRGRLVDLGRDYPTGLDAVRDDEPLVRAWLMHFFGQEDDWRPYAELLREDWLRRLFAETKLLAGQGDLTRWTALVDDPGWLEALKQRVEIAFAPTQPTHYRADEPVALEVDVKNVETLLVKVFEVDAFNVYRSEQREVDASIALDGLVPNTELSATYAEGPLRRVRRRFELPTLSRPGVYVVDLIGNGRSSRAVIHKGSLQLVEGSGSAGQVLRVLDEDGRHLPEATVWLAGRSWGPDERGEIVVPYSTDPGWRPILLRHGEQCSLARLDHREETYRLSASVLVPRESLLSRSRARLALRPVLTVDGRPVPPELLSDPVLAITSIDGQGVTASQEVRDLELTASAELVHEIGVPEGLTRLTVVLRGRVRSLSRGTDLDLASDPFVLTLNGVAATESTWTPLLGLSDRGWFLDLLGKNGEPKADRAVDLRLRARDYTDPLELTLRSDERGRIELGALEGIAQVQVLDGYEAWDLRRADRTWPQRVHGVAGETLRVPYLGRASEASREVVSLLELRGGRFARDAFEHVALRNGFVELTGLAPGDYSLWLAEEERQVEVAVTAGELREDWAVGRDRRLQRAARAPLQVVELSAQDDALTIRLANAGDGTRVHVFATRYLPAFDPFALARGSRTPWLDRVSIVHPQTDYRSGREIGDEYRYILERRYARRFPGNMLARPGLLLNPWALEETAATTGIGGGAGGRFGGRRNLRAAGGAGMRVAAPGPSGPAPGIWPDLDFLPQPARLLANLSPDADGLVQVARADLGQGQLVHVVAVDPTSAVYSTLALAEQALEPVDRRLARPLDPEKAFAEQKRVERLEAGQAATIADVTSARAESYDSLASVFRLYRSLSGDPELARFAFALRWNELTPAEKRARYSEHACHELHFFLWHKDPQFFDEVVRPYLANKADKTFLDHWLLEHDLSGYLDPRAFARLNAVERILLTGRLEGRRADGVRHVRELVELLPSDPERARLVFFAALEGASLEANGALADKLGPVFFETRDRADRKDPGSGEFFLGRGEAGRRPAAPAAAAPAEEPVLADAAEEALEEDAGIQMRAKAVTLGAEVELERGRRAQARELYRAPDPTRAYAESNYWHVRTQDMDADLVPASAFWRDYAERDPQAPFLSTHFAQATGSLTEMMLALSVLDLPFGAGEHAAQTEGTRLELTAASPLLLVRKDVLEARPAVDEPPLLLSQNLLRLDDRWRHEADGLQREAYLTGELIVDVPYACKVVVTNPTSAPRRLDLLLQIPEGSLPLSGGSRTRSVEVELGAYSTRDLEYAFYFPAPGSFAHYPAHASREGALVAAAEAATALTVVPVPTTVDTTSWQHVSQMGTPEEVLAYLEQANLQRVDLGLIAWRLRERTFFESLLGLLRRRLVYADVAWSYGLLHRDEATAREYLRHQTAFLDRCGRWLASPLVSIDPVERREWQLVEFEPIHNARAHPFAGRREILDRDLALQYLDLLHVLTYRPRLDDDDRLTVTYYLLLQDRVAEALDLFAQVDPEGLATRLQYDYMRAYMDFFSDEPAVARQVAEAYREHPVERWRERFGEVLRQLDEAAGAAVAGGEGDDRTRRQTELAASEPALELDLEGRRLRLAHRNLPACEVRYYPVDVEFQFSTSPFARSDGEGAVFVRPARADLVRLAAEQGETVLELPAELAGENLLVEVRAAGLVRRQPYYASTLDVQTQESYGQLVVTAAATGKPLPKVYVKVYARTDTGVRFHKDGYTDLRGRFDYASLSGERQAPAERFAILVLSDTDGAALREVSPPLQ